MLGTVDLEPRRLRRGDRHLGHVGGDDRTKPEPRRASSPVGSSRCPRWCLRSRSEDKRLHALARQGVEVEREPRWVTVDRFDVSEVPGETGVLGIEVDCSTGHLREDLGSRSRSMRSAAERTCRGLRRTKIGSFGLQEAHRLEELAAEHVLTPAQGLRDLQRVEVGCRDAPGGWPTGCRSTAPRSTQTATGPLRRGRPQSGGCWPCTSRAGRTASSPPASSRRSLQIVEVIAGPEHCTPPPGGGAVTIGAYDGVHLGHQMLLGDLRDRADALGLVTEVVTFDRHPATVVRPDSAPLQLTDLEQKLELLAAAVRRPHGGGPFRRDQSFRVRRGLRDRGPGRCSRCQAGRSRFGLPLRTRTARQRRAAREDGSQARLRRDRGRARD